MSRALDELLSILDIERLEVNLYRGLSPQVGWQRVFGGQVIGQALVAANRTVTGRNPHSLHAYFLRAGDPSVPIIYEVDRIRDGGSFSTRRVVAIQHGQAIFSMAASFHREEPGLHHQIKMPGRSKSAPSIFPAISSRATMRRHNRSGSGRPADWATTLPYTNACSLTPPISPCSTLHSSRMAASYSILR